MEVIEKLQQQKKSKEAIEARIGKELSDSYPDKGYTSASTSILTAIDYTGDDGLILVIDLPKGYKAVSFEDVSAKPWEKEVLLNKGADLRVSDFADVQIDGKRYRLYFVEGAVK